MGITTLILGGARSGKSRYAEAISARANKPKLYVATSETVDDEMRARIEKHQQDRAGDGWETIEAPLTIASIIADAKWAGHVILVDCLTLWLGNLFHYECDVTMYKNDLLAAIKASQAELIFVSNEVGLGIVPESKLARIFRDEAGMLHQEIAKIADNVVMMVAGIPLHVKGS